MIEYLIKSIICFGVLYLGFILLLNKSRHYKINRFYLISAVIFSLLTPIIHFSTQQPLNEGMVSGNFFASTLSAVQKLSTPTGIMNLSKSADSLNFLPVIYFIITFILLGKFIVSLFTLISQSHHSKKTYYRGIKLVLLDKKVNPFNFFRLIYVNNQNFQAGSLDHDLILHELAHRNQYHSVDVFFMELLQVLFWFNPFVYLFKRLIKINHEFLADDFVMEIGNKHQDYSKKLLSVTFKNRTLSPASGFNYSLIKRRLIMLSKYNQKKRFLYQFFVFIPIFFLLFISTTFSYINKISNQIFNVNPTTDCIIHYYGDKDKGGHIVNGNKKELFSRLNDKYFVHKEPISATLSETNKKTTFKLANYQFKEINGEIFIDDLKVGSVQKHDIIILHHDKRVDVYHRDRVRIKEKQKSIK